MANEEAKPIDLEESKRLIAEDRAAREQECFKELEALLKKHRCRCEYRQMYVNGQPGPAQLAFVAE